MAFKHLPAMTMPLLAGSLLRERPLSGPYAVAVLFARKQPAWKFDLLSALIGFGLGLLLSVAVYLLRSRIAASRDLLVSRIERVRSRISTSLRDRYREQVIETAERNHLLKRYAPLSQIYVEHRFTVPCFVSYDCLPEQGRSSNERQRQMSLYEILHRSATTIDLGNALKQHDRLAILGPVGSGRTTLLAYLAQLFARREGWRLTCDEPGEADPPELLSVRRRERDRLPVWIALESLDFSLAQESGRHAMIEPIIAYLTSSLRGIIARPSSSLIRSHILEGKCLLLFDNLDMLDPEAHKQALEWLRDLTRSYPDNVFLLAGVPEGYGMLCEIGFAPLILDGFRQQQVSRFARVWESLREETELKIWEDQVKAAREVFDQEAALAKRQGHPPPLETDVVWPRMQEPSPGLLQVWKSGRRQRVMPLDLALAASLWREQDDVPPERLMRHAQAMLMVLDRTAGSLLSPPQWARILASVAWTMQIEERHVAERAEIEQPVADALTQPAVVVADVEGTELQQAKEEPDYAKLARAALDDLLEMGSLLMDVGRGRVGFVHPIFRTYFAAQYAARNDKVGLIIDHIRDPLWQDLILFYSALGNVTPLAMERLKGPDDVFRSNFFAAAGYLAASPQVDRRLHGGVLAELAQVFLDPAQPTLLRRRAATAIADTRDKGALYLFGQALRHPDPHVRRLGVWGLAQMDDERLVQGLLSALSDRDPFVRVDALYALGSLGSEQVVEGLVAGLQDEHELPRRVAAEALASIGGEGHDVLRRATESEDLLIRRAAVNGLGAVNEPWAAAIIDRLSREDKEWFVRSAATEAMEQINADPPLVTPSPPRPEDEAWLVSWAAERGIGVGIGDGAFDVLLRALEEGDWTAKLAAAETLRVCGDQKAIPPLRAALADDDILVRELAYAALCEISERRGIQVLRDKEG